MENELAIAIRAKIEYIDGLKGRLTAINYQYALANDRIDLVNKLKNILNIMENRSDSYCEGCDKEEMFCACDNECDLCFQKKGNHLLKCPNSYENK